MNVHPYHDPDRPDLDLVRFVFVGGHMILSREAAHRVYRAFASGLGLEPGGRRFAEMHRRAQKAESTVRAYEVLLEQEPKPHRRWARYADIVRARSWGERLAEWSRDAMARREARLDQFIRDAWGKVSTQTYPGDDVAHAAILADLDAMAQLRTLLAGEDAEMITGEDAVDIVANMRE